jgi:hypothetical protein
MTGRKWWSSRNWLLIKGMTWWYAQELLEILLEARVWCWGSPCEL